MKKIWLVSVNMGYGHLRAAFPLRKMAQGGEVICANDYKGIPEKDETIWKNIRKGYELISRLKRIPLLGYFIFFIFNKFQMILKFYPKRDLSKPSFQLEENFSLIEKGWGKDLIERLRKKPIPLVSTFFVPAFMAEHFDYPGDIFCVICDADISRAWAPEKAEQSRIKYLVPNQRVEERLRMYGVKSDNIFLTGYPLPGENIGDKNSNVVKEDLRMRLLNLDPKKRYFKYYEPLIKSYLGGLPKKSNHLLTLTFAVGGAGAQKKIGVKIVKNLASWIKSGKIKVVLVAGTKEKVAEYFKKELGNIGLGKNKNVKILFKKNIEDYFLEFNSVLRQTDILWTKPSELSFYSALGLPIIIAPPIGSQEKFNKSWLLKSGFGISQADPVSTDQWLSDWLENGYLAEAAMQGFIEGKRSGVLSIKQTIEKCSG